jgi:hypothetical protein
MMGWNDFYRRRDALNSVIESGELTAPDPFDGPTEVLLALHHRWSLQLAGRVELAGEIDPDEADQVDAVGTAWRAAAAANPGLRRLLDEHANHPALRGVTRTEHRMLANAAGLTGPDDGRVEQDRVGAAFVALLRNGPPRRTPVERLLGKLVPSG